MKTLVIIPVINVEKTILQVVDDLQKKAPQVNYLVVDYGSQDRTIALLANNAIPYLSMPLFSKYKYALSVGMQYAKNEGYDSIIEYDGQDLYYPEYIAKLLKLSKTHDLVLGSRFLTNKYKRKKKLICKVVSWSIKVTTHQKVTDPTMRYRLYKMPVIEPLLKDKYWKSGPDAIAYLIASGYKFKELSMELKKHKYNKSYSQSTEIKRKRFAQGMKWILSILFVQPFRKPFDNAMTNRKINKVR